MRKYISKIGLIFLMAFVIGIGYGVSAKAADDGGVVGTTNLNDTSENSAKVGQQLKQPEKGWKRYDDSNKNIVYDNISSSPSSGWVDCKENGYDIYFKTDLYFKTTHFTEKRESKAKFKFEGTKLRMVASTNMNGGRITIKIDGKEYDYGTISADHRNSVLLFECLNLVNKEHLVEIKNSNSAIYIDAIDIDANGMLIPFEGKEEIEKSISLDKDAISLLEGQSEKLTATIKPDNIGNKKIIWSSSDNNIATVDQNGNVTAVKEGKAVVTAKLDGTNLKAECKVTVTKQEITEESQGDRAILSITMVSGATKDYDLSMSEVNNFMKWFDDSDKKQIRYGFSKKINPYKSVKEYVIFDKIESFEIRQYDSK